ncbi:MAG: hypothetical protein R3E42_11965 [Burkholderiaceae bacterium]
MASASHSHNRREVALASEIQRSFPSMSLIRFTNSGTEASLLALAAAQVHTGRRNILVFDGAYHGGLLSFGRGGSPINAPTTWWHPATTTARGRGAGARARSIPGGHRGGADAGRGWLHSG